MRIVTTLIAMTAVPLIALGQTTDQQDDTARRQKGEQQENTAPHKKKARQEQPATRSHNRADANTGTQEGMKAETHGRGGSRSDMSSSKTTTKVNKEEFKSRHHEVFTLGRHPKEFFVKRYGPNHFRLIGNTYYVFVDDCWVAVDVAGFTFVQRVICPGDPDYIVVY